MRFMSKIEYLIIPKGTKCAGKGKLGLMLYICTSIAMIDDSGCNVHTTFIWFIKLQNLIFSSSYR